MMRKLILSLLSIFVMAAMAVPAVAQSGIHECSWVSQARNIVEPWAEHTRTFANGKIRIAHLDTGGEPVCCSSHLLIIAPDPNDEQGYNQCRVLSGGAEDPGQGFLWIRFEQISASYDPARGLLLSVPVRRYVDGLNDTEGLVEVRINQATGAITIE